jgi:hypothetical protein
MDLNKCLFELGNILSNITSIYSDCVIGSGTDVLIQEEEAVSPAIIISPESISDYTQDESDILYDSAIIRITMCVELARLLLTRIGGYLKKYPRENRVGDHTHKSVSDLSEEVHALNVFVRIANRLIQHRPIDLPKENEVKLLQAMKDACNTIITPINEVLKEHNNFFANDKSMQVDLVDAID